MLFVHKSQLATACTSHIIITSDWYTSSELFKRKRDSYIQAWTAYTVYAFGSEFEMARTPSENKFKRTTVHSRNLWQLERKTAFNSISSPGMYILGGNLALQRVAIRLALNTNSQSTCRT
jgi:hypothetical protein